jgi:hypothetical protein
LIRVERFPPAADVRQRIGFEGQRGESQPGDGKPHQGEQAEHEPTAEPTEGFEWSAWFTTDNPIDHIAVPFTRVIL